MSSAAVEALLPPADETVLRAHADELRALAATYGISDLRFASAGKLVAHVAEDRDALDVADFEVAAVELMGASCAFTRIGCSASPTSVGTSWQLVPCE